MFNTNKDSYKIIIHLQIGLEIGSDGLRLTLKLAYFIK